jgi:hypothetical protein
METNSQRLVRYRNAQMCEVSDIDEWMELHHGMSDDEDRRPLNRLQMALSRWTSNLEEVKPTAILKGFYHVDAASNLFFFRRDFKLLLLLNESKQQGGVFPIDASCNMSHLRLGSLMPCHRSSAVSVHILRRLYLKQKLHF